MNITKPNKYVNTMAFLLVVANLTKILPKPFAPPLSWINPVKPDMKNINKVILASSRLVNAFTIYAPSCINALKGSPVMNKHMVYTPRLRASNTFRKRRENASRITIGKIVIYAGHIMYFISFLYKFSFSIQTFKFAFLYIQFVSFTSGILKLLIYCSSSPAILFLNSNLPNLAFLQSTTPTSSTKNLSFSIKSAMEII